MEPATTEETGQVEQKNTVGGVQREEDAAQNINLNAKFLFGLKGDVRNNIHFLDDNQRVVYPCGHNVVIYHMDEKTQNYIQGIEGSEGITALAVSPSKKFLAVAERAERAICCIYDLHTLKRKKIITSTEYQSKQFLSLAFAPSAERSLLVTLTSEPNIQVIVWIWDKQKFFVHQSVPGVNSNPLSMQVSFHLTDQNTILVTGHNCYKFFKIQENQMKTIHSSMAKKEPQISNNYTCHLWLPDGKCLVCTDQGEILLLEQGDFKFMLQDSPGEGFYIECIQPYKRGFIIAGDNGTILMYERGEEPKNPYQRNHKFPQTEALPDRYEKLYSGILSSRIMSLALSGTDDCIVFTTNNNQIMKLSTSLERPQEDAKYEYMICPFHWRTIPGMDICLKKKWIATASTDRTVRIWDNNATPAPELLVCEMYQDEAYSVAFHPSGFHLIVGFTDRIRMLNVMKDALKEYSSINIKSCREIKFSHGGHMFAIAHLNQINVYKFYTGENTPELCYKGHFSTVRCIHWFDDDSGFLSGGWDGYVYYWNLYSDPTNPNDTNPKQSYYHKGYQFTSVVNKPDSKDIVYSSGMDKCIKVIQKGKLVLTYEAGLNISQICIMHGGRAMFAGIAEGSKPGSIQVINFAFQKISEVQAHSAPLERMRIAPDNSHVFTTGQDYVVGIFKVDDQNAKKDGKEGIHVLPSDEILISQKYRTGLQQEIDNYRHQIAIKTQERENITQQEIDKKQKEIQILEAEYSQKDQDATQRYSDLLQEKKEKERQMNERIESMEQAHAIEKERRRLDYDEKEAADQARFDELQDQRDADTRKFEERLNELALYHEKIIKELEKDQRMESDRQQEMTTKLNEEIARMIEAHKAERERIENETWNKIDVLKNKNKEELGKIIDKGMQSKAELTLGNNKHRKRQEDRILKQNDIERKQHDLNELHKDTNNLQQQIESQEVELRERDSTIQDKDQKINELRKKTQELEKFKFVLDYKIKELKREIGPRETRIQLLKEQTNKFKQEMKHFSRVNLHLTLIVEDLRMRQEGLTKELESLKKKLDEQEEYKKMFKDDVHETLQHALDKKKLKPSVIHLYKKYVTEELKNEQSSADDQHAHKNARRYLEENVATLHDNMNKKQKLHKKDQQKIMNDNVELLSQINEQSIEKHHLRQQIKKYIEHIQMLESGNVPGFEDDQIDQQVSQTIRQQEFEIEHLSAQIQQVEQQNAMWRQQKPHVGRIAPMESADQQALYQQQQQEQYAAEQAALAQQQQEQQMQMEDDMESPGMGMEMGDELEEAPRGDPEPPAEASPAQADPGQAQAADGAGGEEAQAEEAPAADMEGEKPAE